MLKAAAVFLFSGLIFFAPGYSRAAKSSHKEEHVLVFLGDSLTEGYGVAKEKAYPALIETKIKTAGLRWRVINAGISGSTSASAKGRLQWLLKSHPKIVVLALGANDGLRGFPPEETKKALQETIAVAKQNEIQVILAGMKMPPNYGGKYGREFERTFVDLAKQEKLVLIPFLLERVAGEKTLNQEDGIHPNEKGHAVVAGTVWTVLAPILNHWKETP